MIERHFGGWILSGCEEINFAGSMDMAPVRHLNDRLELMRPWNWDSGFKAAIFCVEIKGLARIIRPHSFDSNSCIRGHRTRLLVFVMEKEAETRRLTGFEN